MVALTVPRYCTKQEYLEREERAAFKSEYHNGVIVAMAGASPEHTRIAFNVGLEVGEQIRDGDCQGYSNDLRVFVPDCNKYYYPDTTIACGEPEYENVVGIRSLLNPTVIFEVLSGSTERADRTEKYDCCRTIESLANYVLVAQESPRIESFTRLPDGTWRHTVAKGMEATLALDAIGCTLRLANIYARIVFPPALDDGGENMAAVTEGGTPR